MNFGDRDRVIMPDAIRALVKASDADARAREARQTADFTGALHRDANGRYREAEVEASQVLFDARTDSERQEAALLLENAQRAAEALLAEADALAAQRRAQAEQWSRAHIAEADQVGTQKLLDAEFEARKIRGGARTAEPTAAPEPAVAEPVEQPAVAPEPVAEPETTRSPRSRRLKIAAVVVFVAAVLGGTVLIRSFVAQPFTVESSSMEPELHAGDRLLVDKVAYKLGNAKRGDVVVVDAHKIPTAPADLGDSIVKRVVALPGDVVSAQNGRLFIDGSPIDEPWLGGVETDDFAPIEVPDGAIFVMGDNRAESVDSRVFGPVPIEAVRGRVEAVVWPPDHVGRV